MMKKGKEMVITKVKIRITSRREEVEKSGDTVDLGGWQYPIS